MVPPHQSLDSPRPVTEARMSGAPLWRARDMRDRPACRFESIGEANTLCAHAGYRRPYPRPTNGIRFAITVMNSTLVSSGSEAM
jgi:hypothetical protein